MCKACGYMVQSLLKLSGWLSTQLRLFVRVVAAGMDNPLVVRILSKIRSHGYAQQKIIYSPLFEQVLYPVSTTPIITKKN